MTNKPGIYKIIYRDKNDHLRSRTCFLVSADRAFEKIPSDAKITEVVYLRPEWRLAQ